MSAVAVSWADGQRPGSPVKKSILSRLARWADDDGLAWTTMPVLAEDVNASVRTVQRAMRELEAQGYLSVTGKTRGRNIRYYQLNLARRGELAAERAARQAQRAKGELRGRDPTRVDDPSTPLSGVADGDNDDAARVLSGARHDANGANGDTKPRGNGDSCAANGDRGVTQSIREKENSSANALSNARSNAKRDEVCSAWQRVAPDRVSRPKVARAWQAQLAKGVSSDDLAAAAFSYLASDEVKRGYCKDLHVWLYDERWRARLGTPPTSAKRSLAEESSPAVSRETPKWSGPPEVREVPLRRFGVAVGEPFAKSYVDPCGWDAVRRVLLARTRIAAERLEREIGRELRMAGVAAIGVIEQGSDA